MSHDEETAEPAGPPPLAGLLAEYEEPEQLVAASKMVRDAGYTRWDTYAPFPVHGIDPAMGIKATILPWIVLAGGLTGLATAVAMQWWMNAHDYPWIVSGKPFWSIPANVPISFELTVLFSAFAALGGMLALNKLPLPHHPLDVNERFARSTDDRFFVWIEAADPRFGEKRTRELLDATGPSAVEAVHEDRTTSDALPRGLVYAGIVLATASLIPFALAYKARHAVSSSPRIHIVPDMDFQKKYKAQTANPFFADGRAARPPVEGTVAHGELRDDERLYQGKSGDAWTATFPPSIEATAETMARGQERFDIFCTPCHGQGGRGDGMVARRAEALAEGTWVPPTDVTQEHIRAQPVGQLFNTITNGIRNMPAYGAQIEPRDRWAIVMYLRALQRAQHATIADVPEGERAALR
jgi:mono/diheme cytochrome c family protein